MCSLVGYIRPRARRTCNRALHAVQCVRDMTCLLGDSIASCQAMCGTLTACKSPFLCLSPSLRLSQGRVISIPAELCAQVTVCRGERRRRLVYVAVDAALMTGCGHTLSADAHQADWQPLVRVMQHCHQWQCGMTTCNETMPLEILRPNLPVLSSC